MKTRKSLKKRLWTLIFILVCGGVIAYTAVHEFTRPEGAVQFRDVHINVLFLLPALGCFLLALGAEVAKYYLLISRIAGKKDLPLAIETALLGKYYDNITPFGAGGQPFQIYELNKQGISPAISAVIPITGFLSLQLAFGVLALGLFIYNMVAFEMQNVTIQVMAYVGFFVYMALPFAILLFSAFPKAGDKLLSFLLRVGSKLKLVKNEEETREKALSTLADYHSCIHFLFKSGGLCVSVMALSLLYHVALYSIPFFVVWAFGGYVKWLPALVTTVFIYAAITFIPTPGNAGAAEGYFYLVFSMLSTGYVFWAMLVWRGFVFYGFIAAGLLVFLFRLIRKKKGNGNE